jgi:hypothetical protein
MISALLMLACVQSPGEAEDIVRLWARGRGGAWISGGWEFEGVQLDGTRKIDGRALYTAGLDIGAEVHERVVVFAGVEYAWAGDVTLEAFSFGLGWTVEVPEFVRTVPPFRFTALAGPIYGTFEVDQDRFADFEDAWGVRAGVQASFRVWGGFEVGLYAEGRFIRFKYEESVLDGDRYAGGGGFAGGATLDLRF